MAELVYTAITSLDGYVADVDGRFDWAAPDDEVHAFVNDLERGAGTYLYGRRMWETMRFWEQDSPEIDSSPISRDYAAHLASGRQVVFSRTLAAVTSARDAPGAAVRARRGAPLEARRIRAAERGRPGLAAAALAAGLVDELRWIAVPVVVGGGTRWLPDGLRADLELLGRPPVRLRCGLPPLPHPRLSATADGRR